jgi:hypothetical protein
MLFSLFLCAALAGEPKWGFKIFEGLDHVYAMSSDGNVSSSAAYFANRAKSVSDTAGYELLSARNRLTVNSFCWNFDHVAVSPWEFDGFATCDSTFASPTGNNM